MEEKFAEKHEEECKIPVFTVLKNNSILKNIFLTDRPPPPISSPSLKEKKKSAVNKQEFEEIFIVGRHPDCNITLEHPSISRFHLRIRSVPSLQSLSVLDLSSVHGTWVSGKRIEPGVPVELHEGDILQLGVSSRIYRLHWVPISSLYDFNNPCLPTIDESEPQEDSDGEKEMHKDEVELCGEHDLSLKLGGDKWEGEGISLLFSGDLMEDKREEIHKGDDYLCPDDHNQTTNDDLEGLKLLFNDMNMSTESKSWNPSSPFTLSGVKSPSLFQEDKVINSSHNHHDSADNQVEERFEEEDKVKQWNPSAPPNPESTESHVMGADEKENHQSLEHGGNTSLQSPNKSNNYWNPSASPLSEDAKSLFCSGDEEENKNRVEYTGTTDLQTISEHGKQNKSLNTTAASGKSDSESIYSSPRSRSGKSIWKRRGKSVCIQIQSHGTSSRACVISEVKPLNQENLTNGTEPMYSYESGDKAEELAFIPDKENCTPNFLQNRSLKKTGETKVKVELSANSLTHSWDGENEEAFTPDKENISPATLLLRSMKKVEVEEIKHSKTYRSSPLKNADPNVHRVAGKFGSSDKGHELRKVLQGKNTPRSACRSHENSEPDANVRKGRPDKGNEFRKVLHGKNAGRSACRNQENCEQDVNVSKGRPHTAPFQFLVVNSNAADYDASSVEVSTRSCGSMKNPNVNKFTNQLNKAFEEKNKKWTMVVDTACLLDKESRKALQLMQGLPRTSLIVPRIVIRELDCLTRHGSLLRSTKLASAALEWIDDCMVNAHTWIHVQSAMEDKRQIAPTPPASPFSRFAEDKMKFQAGLVPFSPREGLLEIVSPTTEDHVLDCAISFRRMGDNGQTVLLSDDTSLKIKAMAEGLLCETAERFRESLVNPFSERFLWTHSSPRGLTWSCFDDVVLKNKYYNGLSKKQSKSGESARGLKLVLLHNSQFRSRNFVN